MTTKKLDFKTELMLILAQHNKDVVGAFFSRWLCK